MKKICVIGSINIDLTVHTPRFPAPGETITGDAFQTFFGGKGANQAVACGRLGVPTVMLGKLGSDVYARSVLENFQKNGVDFSRIPCVKQESCGIAHIQVNAAGENTIVVVPGANALLGRAFIDQNADLFNYCDLFLFQLETPLPATLYAMQQAKLRGKTVILDPAPAIPLPDAFYQAVDYITPNETELQLLTNTQITDDASLHKAAQILLRRGVGTVIAKAGKSGAYLIRSDSCRHIPGFPVATVDTTAAGDTFNGAFACALAEGMPLEDGIRFANAAAALSVTNFGAQSAQPTRAEVDDFLANQQ